MGTNRGSAHAGLKAADLRGARGAKIGMSVRRCEERLRTGGQPLKNWAARSSSHSVALT